MSHIPEHAPPRRVLVGLSHTQRRRAMRNWVALSVLSCLGLSIVPLAQWLAGSHRIDLTFLLALLVPVALGAMILPARWRVQRNRHASLARAGLICHRCGYALVGLDHGPGNCPECGQPRPGRSVTP